MLYYRDFRKAVLHRKIKSVPIEFYFLLNCFIKEEKKSIGTNLMCLKKVYAIETYKEEFKMNIGYIRVSTEEQNTIRQEVLMKELGVEKIFMDKASGKNAQREELKKMMDFARQGDTVICESISRFARNTKDLLDLIEELNSKDVIFVSKKESIDTNTPTGKFMLTVFGAVAELEREYILQRQREGIAEAKKQGKYKGRKRIEHPEFQKVVQRWRKGDMTAKKAMELLGMKKNTFYRRVRENIDTKK